MRMTILSAPLVALAFALASPSWAATQAGFALRDITPPGSLAGICLGGYGAGLCRQATGIHDRLHARALVLHSTTTRTTVALVSLDVIGASHRVIRSIQAKVNSPTSLLPSHHVIVAQTHSHATPDLVGLWGKVPAAYKTYVTDQAAAAVREAFHTRMDAFLYASTGTFSEPRNRRGWQGTDPELVVLDARSASTGTRIATLIHFAVHPILLGASNTLISRDWVGPLVDLAEARLGAGKVMFLHGAQGDAAPRTDRTGGATELERARRYGEALARRALDVLQSGQLPIDESVTLRFAPFTQCITQQSLLAADAAGSLDQDLLSGDGCPWTGPLAPRRVATQVAALRLGTQVQAAVVPGEALSRMSIEGLGAPGFPGSTGSLKSVMRAPVRMVLGLSTAVLGSFVPEDEWNPPRARRNPADRRAEEDVSLGSGKADVCPRERLEALILQDNTSF